MKQWSVLPALLSVLFIQVVAPAQSANVAERSHGFVERAGQLEFSGRMIVRPLQPDTLAARGETPDRIEKIRARASARLGEHLVEHIADTDEFIVQVPPDQTENRFSRKLMGTGDYQYAEPDWICRPTLTKPDDPEYWRQWHHKKIRAPHAWDHETGDASIIVAVVDSGVNLTHPDLAAALVPGYNACDRKAQVDGGDVSDVDGHGTFIAGCAAAVGNNGTQVAGVGWNLSIMPIRYYNSPGGGYLSDLLAGARWAVDNGARCVNVSQTGVEYSTVQTTGEYIKDRDGLLIYAAGNDGRYLDWFDWPDVIVVGGTNRTDNLLDSGGVVSAYGPALDVFAPGMEILATGIEGGLAMGTGTSASTALASGLCALIWSVRPGELPETVERHLFEECEDLGAPGNDPDWGWGRIDAEASVVAAVVTDITANGSDGHVTIDQGTNLQVEITCTPAIYNGQYADWWLLASSPYGLHSFRLSPPGWIPGLVVTYQGLLVGLGPLTVFNSPGLPVGGYEFFFGMDLNANGVLDPSVIYDSIQVTVQ